jgi:hypothetical protein
MDKNMNNEQPSSIQRFLWWLTGATTHILALCPTDHRKYSSIGATMLLIPSMAAFSAGFAVKQTFDSLMVAIVVGLLWFMLVFNIDRLLLISIRKQEGGAVKEFFMALPRLGMVVILSILITEPLLQKLFEGEIANQLSVETQQSAEQARQAASSVYGQEIKSIDDENKRLTTELEELRKERDQRHRELMAEGEGTGGTRKPGRGTFYAEKKAAYDLAIREYEDAKSAADEAAIRNNARRNELSTKLESQVSQATLNKGNAKGFLAKHSALLAIVRQDPSAGFLYFTLSLALILLESTPLTIKLFSKRGHYDQLLERYEQERIYQEKKTLEENKSRIDHTHDSRVESSANVQRLKKEKLEKIIEAILNAELGKLSGDDAEIAALLMSTIKNEVFSDINDASSTKRDNPEESSEQQPEQPTPLLIHIHEPEEELFTVNFNRPESEIKGSDLLYALRGVGDLLPQSAMRPALTDYQIKSDSGREIAVNEDLFPQLAGSRVVHLMLDAQPGSEATN